MLSIMHYNLIGEFENCSIAQDMWNKLKFAYDLTSTTRLQALTLKFEQYVIDSKHTIIEHFEDNVSLNS